MIGADPRAAALAQALEVTLRGLAGSAGASAPRPSDAIKRPALRSEVLEACRRALAALVSEPAAEGGMLAVCSPRRGEGRSWTAAGLAVAIARDRAQSALLWDLDFWRPAQASIFQVASGPGLAEWLERDLADRTEGERLRAIAGGPDGLLTLVPAGARIGDPLKLIHDVARGAMPEIMLRRFDWVVLDLPPLLEVPEAAPLARRADWQVLVGRHRRTLMPELRQMATMLGERERVGFLLTADASRMPRRLRRLI